MVAHSGELEASFLQLNNYLHTATFAIHAGMGIDLALVIESQ